MTETLLTPSSIKIYGRVLKDLKFSYSSDTIVIGANNFLQQQLSGYMNTIYGTIAAGTLNMVTVLGSTSGLTPGMTVISPVLNQGTTIINPITPNTFTLSQNATGATANAAILIVTKISFARIYAFSFEGAIYSLSKPSIFMVHGDGNPIDPGVNKSNMEMAGVAAREWEFSAGDVRYWEYEKGDFSLRLDTEAGPLEQILLAAAIRGADMGDRSGANLGIRSGANLSGANVSGANVSGANLSGANLSGANLRNR
ncbi:MAG: pentapeptide repeat-containing protein [Hyphomicrobiales bacterium]|nr:pentapeptide repeat-containing protein [Hyphomicrobiales bacterium]